MHHPGASVKRGAKSRPRFAEDVQEFLYRFGYLTRTQVSAWLRHRHPELAVRDVRVRSKRTMTRPELRARSVPLPPSYRAAGPVLKAMESGGELEMIGLRRPWNGSKETGRFETAYRLSRSRRGEAIVEGGLAAGVEAESTKGGYARIWYGGAVSHSVQRADLLELLVAAGESADYNECGIVADPESAWGESSEELPLVGARRERRDAAGRPRRSGEESQRSSPGRTYDRVVPDATITLTMLPLPTPSPLHPEGSRASEDSVEGAPDADSDRTGEVEYA